MNKYTLFFCFIWINLSVSAQDVITSFLDKHGKDDNLEVISIGKKMLEMMCSLTSEDEDLKEAIKGLENIRIISSKEADLNKEYYNFAQKCLTKSKGFEAFFSVNEENEELSVMIKESKGFIKELILLSNQPNGFNLISISGNINLDVLLKYSEKLNIKGLDHLRSIERSNNK